MTYSKTIKQSNGILPSINVKQRSGGKRTRYIYKNKLISTIQIPIGHNEMELKQKYKMAKPYLITPQALNIAIRDLFYLKLKHMAKQQMNPTGG